MNYPLDIPNLVDAPSLNADGQRAYGQLAATSAFAQKTLELFSALHRLRQHQAWPESVYRAVKSVELAAQSDSLKGCVYVMNLMLGALSKLSPQYQPNDTDHQSLLDWADFVASLANGQVDDSQAGLAMALLAPVSWFPQVPETFAELIQGRLHDDALKILAANRAAHSFAEPVAEPVTKPALGTTNQLTAESAFEVSGEAQTEVALETFGDEEIGLEEVGLEEIGLDESGLDESGLDESGLANEFPDSFAKQDTGLNDLAFAQESSDEVAAASGSEAESAAADEFELLAEAFDQLAQDTAQAVGQMDEQAADSDAARLQWQELVEALQDRFSTAANAARFMNVASLDQALTIWGDQFFALNQGDKHFADEYRAVLALLPSFWAGYFRSPNLEAATTALSLLREPLWLERHDDAFLDTLAARLGQVQLTASRQVEQRSEAFDPEDLSLAIPSDADWAVVDNLLRELPALSEQFSGLVTRILQGDNSKIEAAQRIAHTLKGSANTVGIRGVANLTHQLEDIFVIISRDDLTINSTLGNFLSEAADCLEEMSEAVAGVGSAPANSADIYTRAINWTNKLVAGDMYGANEVELAEESKSVVKLGSNATQLAPMSSFAEPTSSNLPVQQQVQQQVQQLASNVQAQQEIASRLIAQTAAKAQETNTESAGDSGEVQTAGESEASVRVSVALIDKLLSLVGESSVLLAKVQNEVETINLTQRSVGDTASRLEELSHDLDRMVDSKSGILMGRGKAREGFDELELDEYNEMHTMARRFAEIGSDSRVLDEQLRQNVLELASVAAEMERTQSSVRDLTLQTRMVPVNSISARLQRAVRQASRLTQKAVQLHVDGGDTLVDNETLGRLVDPLMHLLRNAVDHGVESSSVRMTSGKSEIGQIYVSFIRDGGSLTIRCQDDGQGLNTSRIFSKATERGLIQPGASLSESEISDLILLPGFSTRDAANQLSGRGIGLDVVAQLVRDLKGSIEIQHAPGAGTSFLLTLPLNLSSMPVMVAKSSKFVLALSLRGVEQIVSVESLNLDTDQPTLTVDGNQYNSYYLEDLVGYPRDRVDSTERVAMLVRARRGQLVGVIVPGLGQARNVIVKPLSTLINRIRGIEGAAALGDGSAAPICDLPELLAIDGGTNQATNTPVRAVAAKQEQFTQPFCLVVDDSVSVRRAMESFVSDLGFDVVGARDGIEALAALERRKPALIIADFEMPRMNGVELTRNVRGNERLAEVPIIMITSRSSEKHRNLALEVGVNHYMTKPYTEDDLAEQVYRFAGALLSRS
jgi:chemotaxis protein histidine kinase CheA/ActR/RegA family two-component response regulator